MVAGNRISLGRAGKLPALHQAIDSRPSVQAERRLLGWHSLEAGAFGQHQPISIRSLAYQGNRQLSFFDDFYSQVYLIPVYLDFGTISGAIQRTIVAWNANFRVVTLESITPHNLEGVSLETEDLPLVFKPLAIHNFVATAYDNSGGIVLDGTADFVFDDGEAHAVTMVGVRATLAPFVPNWRESYTVSYEFKTDIFTSTSGKEQRRSLRQRPRKSLEFTATLKNGTLRQTNGLLTANHNLPLVIAEAPRMVSIIETQVAGTAVAVIDDTPDWLRPELVVLAIHGERNETRKVASAAGNSVVFAADASADWPPGTRIYALVRGFLDPSINLTRKTNTVGEFKIVVNVPPGSEDQPPLPAAPELFNGKEIWTHRPNWADDPALTYDHPRETVDYTYGRTAEYQVVKVASLTGKWTFLGRTWAETELMRQFFERMRGQRGEFYMPSWNADIEITRTSPQGSQVIRVPGTQFSKDFAGSTVYRAVAVLMASGLWIYNVVENIGLLVDDLGDDSGIQVRDPWPEELRPDNVSMICWLPVWRFAVDSLALEFVTNSVAQTSLAMKTVEDLP